MQKFPKKLQNYFRINSAACWSPHRHLTFLWTPFPPPIRWFSLKYILRWRLFINEVNWIRCKKREAQRLIQRRHKGGGSTVLSSLPPNPRRCAYKRPLLPRAPLLVVASLIVRFFAIEIYGCLDSDVRAICCYLFLWICNWTAGLWIEPDSQGFKSYRMIEFFIEFDLKCNRFEMAAKIMVRSNPSLKILSRALSGL